MHAQVPLFDERLCSRKPRRELTVEEFLPTIDQLWLTPKIDKKIGQRHSLTCIGHKVVIAHLMDKCAPNIFQSRMIRLRKGIIDAI